MASLIFNSHQVTKKIFFNNGMNFTTTKSYECFFSFTIINNLKFTKMYYKNSKLNHFDWNKIEYFIYFY